LKSHTNSEPTEAFSEEVWREQVLMSFLKAGTNTLPTAPTNDWRLLDVLTATPHPNASRGTLSVNQPALAAWSAVLSGVPVTSVIDQGGNPAVVDRIVEPALVEPELQVIVEGINAARAAQPGGRFHRMADVLAAPELTVDSPYLALRKQYPQIESTLFDADFERIPQQIMSLLKLGDTRFIIYSYGQSLKPAANSILTSGAYFGMCTNYQITAEAASRAVVRVEFEPLSNDPEDPNFEKPNVLRPHLVVESYNLIPAD
jgi:hypothetical protein